MPRSPFERVAFLNAGSFGPLARTTVGAMQGGWSGISGGAERQSFMDGATAVGRHPRAARGAHRGAAGEPRAHDLDDARLEHGDRRPAPATGARWGVTRTASISGSSGRSTPRERPCASLVYLDRAAAETYDVYRRRDRLAHPPGRALTRWNWLTGHRLPLEELAQRTSTSRCSWTERSSVGAIPVDASAYDFYTVSGQKWLCGPDTTGALYVRDPEALEVSTPSYFAQAEYEPEGRYTPNEGGARFDSDWLPPASLAGLTAAVDAAPAWRYEAAGRR